MQQIPRNTKHIVLSSEEEKLLNLFIQFRAPATVEEIHQALKSATFKFEDLKILLQCLLSKELIECYQVTNTTTVYFPTQNAASYFASLKFNDSETVADDSMRQETELLKDLLHKIRQLPPITELKRRTKTLKLTNQHLLVDVWKENLNFVSRSSTCDLSTATTTSQNENNKNEEKKCTNIRFIQESNALLEVSRKQKTLETEKIRLLEEYNEIKDLIHELLGILAEECQCTVKELYKQFDLPHSTK